MSPTILAQLAKRGIQLRRVGDRLGVTAEPGTMTPEAHAYLQTHKDALLAALDARTLLQAVESPAAESPPLEPTIHEAELRATASIGLHCQPHKTATCAIHGCPQRRVPKGPSTGLYRCPTCVPDTFGTPFPTRKAA